MTQGVETQGGLTGAGSTLNGEDSRRIGTMYAD